MEFVFCMRVNIKVSQVGIIVIDGIGQTCLKYPKYFYCDAKDQKSYQDLVMFV